ncbi:MAG: hypothetical protein SVU88_03470 [Candidatus Nanohaloarchaea archaeon]|nr:hypothetical protein [Candidatus Nanohaloarchaea archaeon]
MELIDLTEGDKQTWNRHEGGVYVHGDGYRHFIVKAAVFKVLQEAGHDVATEVQFPNSYIADVVDASTGVIYEVETDASDSDAVAKIENFSGFDVIEDVIILDPEEIIDDEIIPPVNREKVVFEWNPIDDLKEIIEGEVVT